MSVTPSNNQSGKAMWPFEGLSLASATAMANVASLVLIACIVGGLASGFVLVQATGVKERHLSGPSNDLRQQITNLESELQKTKTAVVEATGRAADAQAQLEQAKAQAEQAKAKAQAEQAQASRPAREEQAPPPTARARESQAPPQAASREAAAPPPAPPARTSSNGSRALTDQQMQSLAQKMSSFKGHHVTVGASPATSESGVFADQLVLALRSAGISASRNDASAGIQVGSARGVVARYVTGNDRGEQFANSLVEELTKDGIAAKATGGLVKEIMKELVKIGRALNDPANEWVVVAVGDRAS